ncbi:MAG: sigma-70 family RNA polymerase sigma factor [Planctomycetes bacterium]|nr:sigma-70 family RNA polymerase sigma factor [Planctomycetota bacterium]
MSELPEGHECAEPNLDAWVERWNHGDPEALDAILRLALPWLSQQVHRRLSPKLRARVETQDAVQETVASFLRYGPKIQVANAAQLCALLLKIAEGVVSGQHRFFLRQRRDLARERPLPAGTSISLAPPISPHTSPSEAASRAEREARVRLALEVLDPIDRRILHARAYEGKSHAEIAAELELGVEAVSKRFQRAMVKLEQKVRCLEAHDLEGFLRA